MHFVVPELDAGPVIAQAQRACASPATRRKSWQRARYWRLSTRLYPAALKRLLADNKVKLEKGLSLSSRIDQVKPAMLFRDLPQPFGGIGIRAPDASRVGSSTLHLLKYSPLTSATPGDDAR